MTDFEKKQPAKKDFGSGSPHRTENQLWRKIREWSVAEFVNRVSKAMGAPDDKRLRSDLYAMVFRDGQSTVTHGIVWTGDMVLDLWRKSFDAHPGREPFALERTWDEFAEALRRVRDYETPILHRRALLKIGEQIEARQKPHAILQGWA